MNILATDLKHSQQDHSNWNFSLGIRGRLFAGFLAILCVLFISTCIVAIKMTEVKNAATQVIEVELPVYEAFFDLYTQIQHTESVVRGWLFTHENSYKTELTKSWQEIDKLTLYIDNKAQMTSIAKKEWVSLEALLSQFRSLQEKLINSTAATTDLAATHASMSRIGNTILTIIGGDTTTTVGNSKGGLFGVHYTLLHAGSEKIINDMANARTLSFILFGFTLLLAFFIAYYTARRILVPLNYSIDIAKQIAEGDRNLEIVVTTQDETGKLLNALNTMQFSIQDNEEKLRKNEIRTRELFDNIVNTANVFSKHSSKVAGGDLRERIIIDDSQEMQQLGKDLNQMTDSLSLMTKQITDASHSMVATLEQVKRAVDAQSAGAVEQASSINQITASLEEIEKSANQTSEKAKTLGDVAERTREKGQMGLEAVEQSVNGMKVVREKVQTIAQTILDLSNQTQQVGEITAVVNSLAQQSKMLALNASIEAAKAGEAGKGFAVVASEVKSLAEQSEQSTSQVQKILEDIKHATEKAVIATEEGTKGVDAGTNLVEQTGDIVRSLSDVIHETTIASQQIQAAIRQEGVGIEQITAGMNEINQVTASFTDSVRQTMEAVDSLATLARSLKEYIDVYKL